MSKVCKRHIADPARIYGQCIGCEIEWYQDKILSLEKEIEVLRTSAIESTELPSEASAE